MFSYGRDMTKCHSFSTTNDTKPIAIPRVFLRKQSSLTLSQTTNFRLFQTERVNRRQFQI